MTVIPRAFFPLAVQRCLLVACLLVGGSLSGPLPAHAADGRKADRYQVRSGDSLYRIARRAWGRANQWPLLYRLNRETIGHNPRLIHPGQHLVLSKPTTAVPLATRRASNPSRTATSLARAVPPEPRQDVLAALPAATLSALVSVPLEVSLPSEELDMPVGMLAATPSTEMPVGQEWLVAGASLALPGAGQMVAGDFWRGAAYLGTAAALYGLAWYGRSNASPELTQACSLGLLGVSIAAPIDAFLGATARTQEVGR